MAINPCPENPLRIASRSSPLALAQTKWVRREIANALGLADAEIEASMPILSFVTTGDKDLRPSLADVGGKGLFTKEIELALLNGEADFAVHSMKDMPAEMPPGLTLAAVPPRENPYDAFISANGQPFSALPSGAKVGTSSARRAAQVRRMRPDVEVVPFRGNVDTRLRKLEEGEADGTFLAEAGLLRLGRDTVARSLMLRTQMLPALGQGVLCLQAREGDRRAIDVCSTIHCGETGAANAAERAIVAGLDGSCRTPMAGIGEIADKTMTIVAEVLTPDGAARFTAADRLQLPDDPIHWAGQAEVIGTRIAERLKDDAGPDVLASFAP